MADVNPKCQLVTDAFEALGSGVAVVDADSWKTHYDNSTFSKWFPRTGNDDESLSIRIVDLNEDRARRRLAKGRSYSFNSELRSGARTICLKTTLSTLTVDGEAYVLAESVDVTKQTEFEHMLDSYSDIAENKSRQLEAANRVITAQRDRMQRELEIARDLQMSMLPKNFAPNRQDCTLYGMLKPARELGGDFFDYFFVDDRRVCLIVGDVSDKGAAPALFAAATKTLLKANAHREALSGSIVSRVNQELSTGNDYCMFVTLFLAILDLDSGDITFTNAGHEPPYIVRKDGGCETVVQRHGLPLGAIEDSDYSEDTIELRPGDVLVIYTDGVTDAVNSSNEVFGKERLESILSSDNALTPEVMVTEIVDALHRFEEGSDQADDVTILAVGYNGVTEE